MGDVSFSIKNAFAFCFRELKNNVRLFLYFIFIVLVIHYLTLVATRMVAINWNVPIGWKTTSGIHGTVYQYPTDVLYGYKEIPADEIIDPILSVKNVIPLSLMLLIWLISYILPWFVAMHCVQTSLNIYDSGRAQFKGLFHIRPDMCKRYIFGQILFDAIFLGGLALLIIPGLIWGIRYMFNSFAIVETNCSVHEAFTKSRTLTQGHFWKLLSYMIVIMLICILTTYLLSFLVLSVIQWHTSAQFNLNEHYTVNFPLSIPALPLILADAYIYRTLQKNIDVENQSHISVIP